MNDQPKKKKNSWKNYIATGGFILLGAVCGYLMAGYLDKKVSETSSAGNEIGSLLLLFLGMYLAIMLQMIIHEAGHLVFGLLSGYRFSSFRIMSFMWVKEGGKMKFRRLSIAGTGGQCLMAPPDFKDGKVPVTLYNLGGSIMNVAAGAFFLGLYFLIGPGKLPAVFFLMLAVIGLFLALMNGIPMRMGPIDNDGYNAFALSRNPEALRAFWIQMKTNEQTAKGVRLKDMPDEWFTVPEDEAMKNSMIAATGVFACNRLMDAQQFEEADSLMAHLLDMESGMPGLYRNLLTCDRMYVELITENRKEILDGMRTKEQIKFMKTMKNFPSVLRTQYVYALLGEKDGAKAEKMKGQFEKCAKTYPYPSDVQSERELMEIAAKKEGEAPWG